MVIVTEEWHYYVISAVIVFCCIPSFLFLSHLCLSLFSLVFLPLYLLPSLPPSLPSSLPPFFPPSLPLLPCLSLPLPSLLP